MDETYMSLMDSKFIVNRNEVIKDPVTNTVKGNENITYGPYPCRLGRTTGSFVQATPQGEITRQQVLYTVSNAEIKQGDIAVVDGKNYIVGNIYKPGRHHIEADVVYKGDA